MLDLVLDLDCPSEGVVCVQPRRPQKIARSFVVLGVTFGFRWSQLNNIKHKGVRTSNLTGQTRFL
mgnify:CR=1 FL=1